MLCKLPQSTVLINHVASPDLRSQGKHQPLQFLEISTLREYLRFDFQDLVGPAPDPPEAAPAPQPDEWSARGQDPDSHLWGDDAAQNGFGNSGFSASTPSRPTGDFDFERVLQDFVLLTSLVRLCLVLNVPLYVYSLISL